MAIDIHRFATHARRAVFGLMMTFSPLIAGAAEPPTPIIFDTDMDSDCDDAAALAMLHALADRP